MDHKCLIKWLQYAWLTGSGVVSPAGVVDPSPSSVVVSSSTVEVILAVVVSLFEGVVVMSASIVVDTGTVVGHCPQVFSHLSIIFGLSHLSIFVRQNSSPSLSVHWKRS